MESATRIASILAKSGGRDAKSRLKGTRKSLVILESSFESDIQDGRARDQKQPCPAVQSEPALVRSRCLAEHLHHQSMKLPARKAGGSCHCIDGMRILRRTESPAQTADRVAIPETRAGFHHLFTLQKRISTCLDLFCRFWDIPFLIFDSYLPNVGRHAGERDEMPFASLTLLDNLRERPIFLGQLADAAIVMVNVA